VIATPAIIIIPDNEDGKVLDYDQNEIEEGPHKNAIEPASDTEKQGHNIQNNESDYQIVIPDGAAWEESIS
jgi:hypothetical protein